MYKTHTLSNGLKLITVPMSGTKTVTVLLMVGTGSKYETKENNGISHFLEHMFFKGTKKRPNTLTLSSALDGIGAESNAFTSKEYTGYWAKAASEKIETVLDVISDMLLNSMFDAKEIEKEKGVIIEEINMYLDNPMMYLEDVFENLLYGDTPAGWDTIGTKANIHRFGRAEFMEYLEKQYAIGNSTLVIAGDLSKLKTIEKLAAKYFAAKKFKDRGKDFSEKTAVKEAQKKPAVKVHFKATDQAHLSLGVRTYGYDHKDKVIAKFLSVILGGSMSSRLFINLRERNGLAYYVMTQAEFYTDSGYLTTRAGVPVDKLEQAIKIILSEYRKIAKDPVGAKEMIKNRDLLAGRMAIQFEESDNLANWYAQQAVMIETLKRTDPKIRQKIINPDSYKKEINKITAADIRRVAKDIFVNRGLNLAVIGPYKSADKFKKLLHLNS